MSCPEYSKDKKEKILIESFGGNGGLVTGSCNELQIRDSKIMVDFGLFQGGKEEKTEEGKMRNSQPFDVYLRGVSDVILTHTHIDHIGRLPMIFKQGFRPKVYATEATVELAEKMLKNSAEVQRLKNKEVLYDAKDVDTTLRYLKGIEEFREFSIGQKNSKIVGQFLPNGHILGASSVLISDRRNPRHFKNILFSGDIGKPVQSISGGFDDFADGFPDDPIHAMLLESTNFDKEPVSFEEKEKNLLSIIKNVWQNGGNILLPVLSLHRSQEIMEMLHNWQKNGNIPRNCKIVIDAPLAMELTGVYEDLGSDYFSPRYGDNPNFYKDEKSSLSRFNLKNLTIINSHESSIANDRKMAKYKGKVIILASGGMFGHGRSVNYQKGEFCKNPKNSVIFTCFQVDGTDGARILYQEFDRKSKKNLETHDKKGRLIGAQVFKAEGFTSHASGPEIIDFVGRFNLEELKLVNIGHGRNPSREKMAIEFQNMFPKARVITPALREVVTLYA